MLKLFTLSVLSVGFIGCQTIKEEVKEIDACEDENCSSRIDPIADIIPPLPEEECDSPDCIEHSTPIEDDIILDETQKEFLDAHNDWRKTVGIEPLQYDFSLEEKARNWSQVLIDQYFCKMMHNPRRGQSIGENIYWHSNHSKTNPKKAVDAWGSEVKDYDYNTNTCASGKVCGHYTQVVWKDTKYVGCSIRRCDTGKQVVVVCNYKPAGNWVGEKPY